MTAAKPICGVYIQKNMQRRRIPFRESLLPFTTQTTQTRHGTTAPLLDISVRRGAMQSVYRICMLLALGFFVSDHHFVAPVLSTFLVVFHFKLPQIEHRFSGKCKSL